MSEAEFKKIDELYAKKINLRLKEIAERFIWTDSVVVEVSAAETLRHLDISEAKN